jgi:hypothetical protein
VTVNGRPLCLDELRARQARRGDYVGSWLPEPVVTLRAELFGQALWLRADAEW